MYVDFYTYLCVRLCISFPRIPQIGPAEFYSCKVTRLAIKPRGLKC